MSGKMVALCERSLFHTHHTDTRRLGRFSHKRRTLPDKAAIRLPGTAQICETRSCFNPSPHQYPCYCSQTERDDSNKQIFADPWQCHHLPAREPTKRAAGKDPPRMEADRKP